VRHFTVELGYSANQLDLVVSDRGTGFEVEAAMNKGGLGLISMRERVRLVNGMISIESKPMGGTTIRARVPFEAEKSAQRIAV
jgi:signal transduction histidine kinase